MKKLLTPKFINKYTDIYRSHGLKGLIKKGGIKLLIIFFLFYLIRDSVIYILIPIIAARGCGLI